ncbi:hypothetical protein, partial [Cupriavidus sp.]|uniref:hypothetical protein n=2 Tax=Cupriavidus sp. TaxID=1873897 RepID=UPI0025C014BB
MRQILHRKEQQPGNALPHKALIYKRNSNQTARFSTKSTITPDRTAGGASLPARTGSVHVSPHAHQLHIACQLDVPEQGVTMSSDKRLQGTVSVVVPIFNEEQVLPLF